ncbi:CAAX protease family protein [Kineosporia sp. NBRC 101677]|uniref:CPBP family intramembrane glutamic endopeptidase n=1 Tax=Kineosporia sp. NBRC 101677 TaxID=3032197 RepID=UPI0024A2B535|nr:type II CAAX endopeptidase family protein [Kineosporia sp. NBRC 101677]GLY17779.1 CAAX protease family protein [Kineosporia sp. NBRC 101677]
MSDQPTSGEPSSESSGAQPTESQTRSGLEAWASRRLEGSAANLRRTATGRTVENLLRSSLIERVPRDHREPDAHFRRRRIVTALTLVLGAALLGISLAVEPGDPVFYPLTLSVALVWTVGGLASGPLHLGWIPHRGALRRPLINGIVLGLVAGAIFVAGALVVREIPPLRDFVAHVLAHEREGALLLIVAVALLNGLAEEVFFRGALFAAIGRQHPVLISTVIYALATIATRNPMLVFAAFLLGAVLGLERRASGGILAPMATHATWSLIMLVTLPPLFAA